MAEEKLEKHDLFAPLNPREIERLSNASGVVSLKQGERFFSEGHPASHLFVLLKGRVELRRPMEGGLTVLVEDLHKGSLFGVSSLWGGDRYLLNAECVEDAQALKVEVDVLRRILDDNPIVGYAIQKRISRLFYKRFVNARERLEPPVT